MYIFFNSDRMIDEYYIRNIERLKEIEKSNVFIENDKCILYTVIEKNDCETLEFLTSNGFAKVCKNVKLTGRYSNFIYELEETLLSIPTVNRKMLNFLVEKYGVDFSILDTYRLIKHVTRHEILRFLFEDVKILKKHDYIDKRLYKVGYKKFSLHDYALYANASYDVLRYLETMGVPFYYYIDSSPLEDPYEKPNKNKRRRIL